MVLSDHRFKITVVFHLVIAIYKNCYFLQVLLTTPTTPTLRMEAITEASQGFVYLVSKKRQTKSVMRNFMLIKKTKDKRHENFFCE